MLRNILLVVFVAAGSMASQAALVDVTARGIVIFRASTLGAPLSGVNAGNTGVMSFQVDSDNFVDGIPGDLRSYPIDPSSFSLTFQPSGVTVGLVNPFPPGETPYFTLVDGFPVSDGFFVSTRTTSPGGVPISQTPLQANLDLGYGGNTLSSLDILQTQGTYDFTGLTRFGFNLWQVSPDNVRLDMDFQSLTIQVVPEPCFLGAMAVAGLLTLMRRRRLCW